MGRTKAFATAGEQSHVPACQQTQHHEKKPKRGFGQEKILYKVAQRRIMKLRGKLGHGPAVFAGEELQHLAHAPELADGIEPTGQLGRIGHPDVKRARGLERARAGDQVVDRPCINRRQALQRRGALRQVSRQEHAPAGELIHEPAVFRHVHQRVGRRRPQLAIQRVD